jgi:hypothetical protein
MKAMIDAVMRPKGTDRATLEAATQAAGNS